MSNINKKCDFKSTLKNMNCETKFAYLLIIILIISNIVFFIKLSKGGNLEKSISIWIDKNPKVILESVNKFAKEEQAKNQQQQQKSASVAIKNNLEKFRSTENTGVLNPKGSKIVVEFYDYNCGYCRMVSKATEEVAKDPNIKIVYRELPILSEASILAAQYSTAVAMVEPERFGKFHITLMNGNPRNLDGIKEALKATKISFEKIESVVKKKATEIEERLKTNRELAVSLGIQGTPALIIGEEFIPGYLDAKEIKAVLDKQK